MLPHFLKHYDFADRIVIYDNGSTDGSIELIKNSKAELRHYDTNGEQDNLAMRSLKNNCWKGSKADWVIVCDMDEHVVGWEKLDEYKPLWTGNVPILGVEEPIIFKTTGYQMVSESPPDDLTTIKLGARDGVTVANIDNPMDKCLCFNPKLKDINYGCGCHDCVPEKPYRIIKDVLFNYHYAFLGEEYVVKRWSDYFKRMSKSDLDHKWGEQYMLGEQFTRETYRRVYKGAKDVDTK